MVTDTGTETVCINGPYIFGQAIWKRCYFRSVWMNLSVSFHEAQNYVTSWRLNISGSYFRLVSQPRQQKKTWELQRRSEADNDYPYVDVFFDFRQPTKLRKANIFSRVCLSVCSHGLPMWSVTIQGPLSRWGDLNQPPIFRAPLDNFYCCEWDPIFINVDFLTNKLF